MKRISIYLILIFLALNNMALSFNMEGLSITGSVSQGFLLTTEYNYLASDSKDGSYKFGEGLMNVSYKPYDELRVGVSIAYRRLGVIGNNEPYINWAIGDYSFREWLSFRIGMIKAPLGFYNDMRDMDLFRTPIILPFGVYREVYRDYFNNINGASIYGSLFPKYLGAFKYQFTFGTSKVDPDAGVVRTFTDALSKLGLEIESLDTDNGQINIDLEWMPPISGLIMKYTYHNAGTLETVSTFFDPFKGERVNGELWGGDIDAHTYSIRYLYGAFKIEGEYFDFALPMNAKTDFLEIHDEAALDGWYVNASYRVFDWLEVGCYFTKFTTKETDITPENSMNDVCLSFRFDVAENIIFKIEGHKLEDVAEDVLIIDNPVLADNPDKSNIEDDWYMFASKITMSF